MPLGPDFGDAVQAAGLLGGAETPEFCSISSSLFSAVSSAAASGMDNPMVCFMYT